MRLALRGALAAGALLLVCLVAGCTNSTPAPIVHKPALPQQAVAGPAAPARPSAAPVPATHEVVKGDTLYAIAFRYGLDHRNLVRWNRLANPNLIIVGQKLRLHPPPAPPAGAPRVSSLPAARTPVLTPIPPATATVPATSAAPATSVAANDAPAASHPRAATTDKPAAGPLRWVWPATGEVTTSVSLSGAKGLDIRGQRGQPVKAAAPGTVVYSGSGLRGYGELIIIKHDDALLSAYAHNESRLAQEGSRVDAGEMIARMGDTDTRDVKLHFEIRRNGKAVDPLQYLPRR